MFLVMPRSLARKKALARTRDVCFAGIRRDGIGSAVIDDDADTNLVCRTFYAEPNNPARRRRSVRHWNQRKFHYRNVEARGRNPDSGSWLDPSNRDAMADAPLHSSHPDLACSHTPHAAPISPDRIDLDLLTPALAVRIFSSWRVAPPPAPPPSPAAPLLAHVCIGPGSIVALDAMLAPRWGLGHAEDPARLAAIFAGLHPLWLQGVRWDILPDKPHLLDDGALRAVYVPQFIADFTSLEAGVELEPRNVSLPNVSCASYPGREFALAARFAAGTVMELACRGAARSLARGFALVRPPGHHGTASSSGGNGVLNSVALAAVALANAGHRAFIVDLDIHFSGGTVEIIRGAPISDPPGRLLSCIAAVDVYGARGQELRTRARKEGRAWRVIETTENATCINVGLLDAAAGDDIYLSDAVLGEIMRQWDAHSPDVVLVSLGLDAMRGDDEGFQLSAAGVGALSRAMASRCRTQPANPGPAIVIALEGGYKLDNLRDAAPSVMRALLGLPPDCLPASLPPKEPGMRSPRLQLAV